MRPVVVDNFAGFGGVSLGIKRALGRSPDIAINHDRRAIAVHEHNHPDSEHYPDDVYTVDPVKVCRGRPVLLKWLSPDCRHFSKSKGGKPLNKKIRGLAWVAVMWAKKVRPAIIVLENVEEFEQWGPLFPKDHRVAKLRERPDPARKGKTFRHFVARLRNLGYVVEWRHLRACDYGAPTSRRRFFLIARCDGKPIVWPTPTHGKGWPNAWRTAAEIIDWSIPCPSIFDRDKPLVPNTLRRIARGVYRFVIESPRPFIVPMQHRNRPLSIDEPLQTITTQHNKFSLIAPTLIQTGYGEDRKRNGGVGQAPRVPGLDKPIGTIVAGGVKHALVAAFLAKHYGGHESPGAQLHLPISTITTKDHHHVVGARLEPAAASAGRAAEVYAFLTAYYGTDQNTGSLFEPIPTIPSRDRFALVTVAGVDYAIADIGQRILTPRELARGQGFPDSYALDIEYRGKRLSKGVQVRLIGNSVPPALAEAIVRANVDVEQLAETRVA